MLRSSRSLRIAPASEPALPARAAAETTGSADGRAPAPRVRRGAGGSGGSISNPTIYDLDGDIVVTGGDIARVRSTAASSATVTAFVRSRPGTGTSGFTTARSSAWAAPRPRRSRSRCRKPDGPRSSAARSRRAARFMSRTRTTRPRPSPTIWCSRTRWLPIDFASGQAEPVFQADGPGAAAKLFRGNRIFRSAAQFSSPNWLIGGGTDAESNLLIGLQAGLWLDAPGLVVRGNYVHNLHVAAAGDDSALSVAYEITNVLAEHNVLRRGTWVVRGFGGELRYNALLNADDLAWIQQPFENTRDPPQLVLDVRSAGRGVGIQGGIQLVNNRTSRDRDLQQYLRRRRARSASFPAPRSPWTKRVSSAVCGATCFTTSDSKPTKRSSGRTTGNRSFPFSRGSGTPTTISFSRPRSGPVRNYGLSVQNRVERVDPGFALNDAHVGGVVDEQVDPLLTGPNEGCFPWSDDDIKATQGHGLADARVLASRLHAAARQSAPRRWRPGGRSRQCDRRGRRGDAGRGRVR